MKQKNENRKGEYMGRWKTEGRESMLCVMCGENWEMQLVRSSTCVRSSVQGNQKQMQHSFSQKEKQNKTKNGRQKERGGEVIPN
jgi:hypothetical protein